MDREWQTFGDLDRSKVRQIRELIASGITRQIIAIKFGVDRKVISDIAQGRIWNHVS